MSKFNALVESEAPSYFSDTSSEHSSRKVRSKESIVGSLRGARNGTLNIGAESRKTLFTNPVKCNPLYPVVSPSGPDERFNVLQKWEGYVQEVDLLGEKFLARLVNKTNPSALEEEVEITTRDLQESDMELLKPGAVFYWSIGYSIRGGTKKKDSVIRFRRLPGMSKRDISRAKESAKKLALFLNAE